LTAARWRLQGQRPRRGRVELPPLRRLQLGHGRGAPSFVTEPEGQGMKSGRRALPDIRRYTRNLAVWLAPLA